MTVCIIGAGGFLGQVLSREYSQRNIEIHKYSSKDHQPLFDDYGLIRENFEIPAGCESVIYLAQSPYYRDLPEHLSHVWNVNVVSAMNVARLACNADVKHFIYTSTGTVYGSSFKPLSESAPLRRDDWYALSKLHAEEGLMLFSNELQISILRLFGLYGPGQKDKLIPCLINKVITGKPVYIEKSGSDKVPPEGLNISLCHVSDAAKIIAELSGSGNCGIMNIASDEVLGIREITNLIANELKIEPEFAIADGFRKGNLIADTGKLKKLLSPEFRLFADSIKDLLPDRTTDKA